MKSLSTALVGLLLVSTVGGCAVSSDTVKFDGVERPATSASNIEIFTTPPDRKHQVIARIQVGPDALVSDYNGQTEELVKLASELGAEAVIVEYGSRTSGYLSGDLSNISGVVAESKFTVGQALVWRRD